MAVFHGIDQRQRVQRVLPGVQGQGGRVFGKRMPIGKLGIFFLNVAAVGQQYSAQVARAPAGIDVAAETLLGQQRQVIPFLIH
jgi:hypothetical protein